MFLSEHVSELYDRWEVFNDRALHKVPLPGGFRWDITGRLISGLVGFSIFVSLLCVHFAIADVDVSPLGGGHIYEIETSAAANEIFNDQRNVNEGDVVEYNPPNESAYRKILYYEVRFSWRNTNGNDVGAPDVRLELWSSNASRDTLTFTDTAFQGTFTHTWVINDDPRLGNDTFTVAAESAAQAEADLERDGETLSARAIYVADNNPLPLNEPLEFTFIMTLVDWKITKNEQVGSN